MGHLVCDNCGEKFDLNSGETPENFDNECDDCDGKLKYVEDDSLIDKIYCTNCETENPEESQFCSECGENLTGKDIPVKKDVPKNIPGICPYCSEKINPKAAKCKHCGEWLDKAVESEVKKDDHSAAIVVGYIFTVLGGVIGLIFGIYLVTRKNERANMHGMIMLLVNIIWIVVLLCDDYKVDKLYQ